MGSLACLGREMSVLPPSSAESALYPGPHIDDVHPRDACALHARLPVFKDNTFLWWNRDPLRRFQEYVRCRLRMSHVTGAHHGIEQFQYADRVKRRRR